MATTLTPSINPTTMDPTPTSMDDIRVEQIFFYDKCSAADGNSKRFYEWCSSSDLANKMFEARCKDLLGSKADCNHTLEFASETLLKEKQVCDLGGKLEVNNFKRQLAGGLRMKVQEHCYYFLMGRPFPWWAVTLIVLAIVIIFGVAAGLFWKYWLKKRWQKPRESTLESRWTESPVSSMSGVSTVVIRPPPPPPPHIQRTPSFGRGSSGRLSISGSRRPTLRSDLRSGRSGASGSTSASRKRRALGV